MPKSVVKIKNKGLLRMEECLLDVVNILEEEKKNFVPLLDIFLSSYKNKYKVQKLMKTLFNMLDKSILLNKQRKTIEFMKKKVKVDDENYLKYKKKINEGTYGEISSCLLNNENVVLKNPKYLESNKDEVNSEFLKENLIHVILYCCHDLMNKCFKISTVPRCIPRIMNLVKATDKDFSEEKLIVVMEKLDFDGYAFFDKKHSYKEELSFLALVAYNIYFLQKSLKNFMHRDFHLGNVMIKKEKKQRIKIKTTSLNFSVDTSYSTYIIDFGMTCFDMASCLKIIQMPQSRISNDGIYHSNYCENRSHDLRLLLASLYFNFDSISVKLQEWLVTIFEKYEAKSWHDFYHQVLKVKDPNFYPENVLEHIHKEFKNY